jgi:putative hemolysin
LESSSVPLSDLAGVVAFVLTGGLFAAADAVITALPEARLRALIENSPASRRPVLERVLDDPNTVLARFLVGRVVGTVAGVVLGAHALLRYWPVWGGALAGAIVLLFYSCTAEIAMSLVRRRATDLAYPLLRIVRPFEIALLPLAAPLALLGAAVASADRRHGTATDPAEDARIAEAEVEYLIEKGQATGVLGDAELLQAAVDFKGKLASDVMVPRTRMVALPVATPLARVLEVITAEGHSRYPVFEGRVDEIVGLLYVKDLFRVVREGKLESTSLAALVRKPLLFVQENQEVSTILKEMRGRRLHMALVLDEFGGTVGLVTLEDILELLVGDIRDELDDDESVQDLGGGRLLVDAALSVDELADRLGMKLPESNGFVSVGGLVMEQTGKVPPAGTVVKVGPIDLVVRDADERRVHRIEVVSRPERANS